MTEHRPGDEPGVLARLLADPDVFFEMEELSNPQWHAYPYAFVLDGRYELLVRHASRIRKEWGAPLYVTPNGGYRSLEHNRAVGGSVRSQHMEGRAMDLRPSNDSPRPRGFEAVGSQAKALWYLIWQLHREGELPALSGVGRYPTFVHIDVGGPFRQDGGPRRWVARKYGTP